MSFFLFPGQGSQQPGMGHDFYEASGPARETLDAAEQTLGPGFLEKIFNGSPEEVNDTRVAQAGLVAVETAVARHLVANGLTPSGCAGHSVGEISALVCAKALDFTDALRIAQLRARFMSEDVPKGGMAAVAGLDVGAIAEHLPEEVNVANYNGPQQTIISGSEDGLAQAEEQLKAAGARRVIRLPVSGPFHSPFMREASIRFREALQDFAIEPPGHRFISSVSGVEESDPEHMRELLSTQLTAPVRWTQVLQRIGEVAAVEAGPGKVLQGIAKRMPGAPAVSPVGAYEEAQAYCAD